MATNKNITLMPSPHAEEARVVLEKIRALRPEIPRFAPAGGDDLRKLNGLNGVPDAALEAASVLIDTSVRVQQAAGADATTLRDSYGYALAYDPVVQELLSLARSVTYSIRVQRATAATSALDVYAIAARMSLMKDGAELLPYVEDIRRKLNKRTRKTNSNPVPAPDVPSAPPRK